MTDPAGGTTRPDTPIPDDDPRRRLSVRRPDHDETLVHLCVAGDTYTIVLDGSDTAGRYCLIDMHVPPGGGPPLHRHDFEELFTILEGEVAFWFRDERFSVRAGDTVNIPANAPHHFHNEATTPARMLCMCTPPGQEQFFLAIGDRVADRTAPPPDLTDDQRAERRELAQRLAPSYRTELL